MKKENILRIKGNKGTFVDSTLKAFFQEGTGYLEISKGFMSLVLSKKQAKKLAEFILKLENGK